MKRAKAKATGAGDDASSGPMSLLDQLKQEPKLGVHDWFIRRRELNPAAKRLKTAGGVVLPRQLLKEAAKQVFSLPAFVPDEAPVFPGGAKFIGQLTQKRLKRFSGVKVLPAVFTQLYNGDSRNLYYDSSYPWACIGQLNGPSGSGTATLVGKNTILTASHVVSGFWTKGGPITGTFTFVPAMFNGTSILGSDWSANVIGIAAWEDTTDQQGYDMAICRLDQPMGDWLGCFGAHRYNSDWEDLHVWTHAGYPYDLSLGGNWPSAEYSIAVRDDDSDSYDTMEIETQADIASGQSGGPLWGVFNGDHRIIGTLSGKEDVFGDDLNSLFAGGNGLLTLIKWGRDNWGG